MYVKGVTRKNEKRCITYIISKQLLSEIRFRDITLRDLTDPAPHRLARILSALINYAKFREGSWETFEEYARKTVSSSTYVREGE